MFIYLLIYIPLLLSSWYDFDGKTSLKKKKQVMMFFVIIFTLFRGLRWNIGTDWLQFLNVYENAYFENIFNYVRYHDMIMDYGYMFINAVFHELGFPYTVFLLATNLLIMLCSYDFSLRHTKYPILTFILLLNVGLPFPVRQQIALAIAIWGFRFLAERKWWKLFIILTISFFIHKATIVAFFAMGVPYVLSKYEVKWWVYALVYLSTFVISIILADILKDFITLVTGQSEYLNQYSEGYIYRRGNEEGGASSRSSLQGLSYMIFFAVLLYVREKGRNLCNKNIKDFEVFFFMYALTETVNNMIRNIESGGFTEILHRSMTTLDLFPLIFPTFFIYLLSKVRNREIICMMFILYMGYKFYLQIFASPFTYRFIPYQSIFDLVPGME